MASLVVLIAPNSLIISSESDLHVRRVLAHLKSSAYVLDFRGYGRTFGASLGTGSALPLLLHTSDGDTVTTEKLRTIWWRRPQQFDFVPPENEHETRYVIEEYVRFWQSALATLGHQPSIRWYNHHKAHEVADCKFAQLQIAKAVGLQTPRTLVTNHIDQARSFIAENKQVIFKCFAGNEGFWQPTRLFREEYTAFLENLPYCPVIFQEYIDGDFDYRIVIIDEQVFAAKFDLRTSRYKHDVRVDTRTKAEKCTLDIDLERQLINFMKNAHLRYSAFDFRQRRDGTMFFLENNPAGQFAYLDDILGLNIAAAMAAALQTQADDGLNDDGLCPVEHAPFKQARAIPFASALPNRIAHYD